MIQERSILKVVPHISERRSRRVEVRGSRLSAIHSQTGSDSEMNGIAPTVAARMQLADSCGTDNIIF